MLVALVTFGVVCRAQMPRPDASDDKSCAPELAICQALLSAVRAKEAKDVVRLAAITPSSSKSKGAIASSRRRLSFACADCMFTDSPCRAEPSALVGKNAIGPADGAQYHESNAPSCAVRLRECRAHGIARRRSTGRGEPLAPRLPVISTNI
jgi:hypothetical protein